MSADVGVLGQVTQQFLDVLQHDAHRIGRVAQTLFYYLVVIQLSITMLWQVMAGESLQSMLSKAVQQCLIWGIFYAGITCGGQWIPDLLNGFIQLGQQGGHLQGLDPSQVLSEGVTLSGTILNGFNGWGMLGHPMVSLIGAFVCISVLILYGLMAAEVTIVLVKAYVLTALSGLFFAFGGSELTRPMCLQYIKASIGLGLQLMTLYLLLGVGSQMGQGWAQMSEQAALHHELMPMLVILVAVIVYYMILKTIPAFIASLSGIGGFASQGATAVGMALNAGMRGARTMSQMPQALGTGIRAGMQGGQGVMGMAKSFAQGKGLGGSIGSGLKQMTSDVGASAMAAMKDKATGNTHQGVGQTFNQHMANRVKPPGEDT